MHEWNLIELDVFDGDRWRTLIKSETTLPRKEDSNRKNKTY